MTRKTKGREKIRVCFLTDESGLGGEVSDGHRDLFDDVLTDHLDVVLELCRDRNDGSSLGHRACRRNETRDVRRHRRSRRR